MADIVGLLDRIREEDEKENRRQRRLLLRLREEKRRSRHRRRHDDLRRPLEGRYVEEAMADAEN